MHKIDIGRIDLNLLVVFEALIEEGHVGRAAGRLCLSQSATSHALGRLRRLFDDPLFTRHATGVEPTRRARALAPRVAEALAGIREIVAPAEPFDEGRLVRSFTIATHDHAMAIIVAPLLSLLRREAPGVDLHCVALSYAELMEGFDRGTVDFACGAMPGVQAARIERTPLFDDHLVAVVRKDHPVLEPGPFDLDHFLAFPHILVEAGGEPRTALDRALDGLGRTRRIGVSVASALAVPSIVAGSDLVGIIPARLAKAVAAHHDLVRLDLPLPVETISCDLLMPRALGGTPDMRWFKALLQRAVGDPAPALGLSRSGRADRR